MTANPNELRIENSAVVLIDHQPWVAFGVESIDRGVLINNVTGLARSAKAAGAKPITWVAVACEWTPDFTSPERNLLNDVVVQHDGANSLAGQYMGAQLAGGLVPAPAWAAELAAR